MDGLVSGPPFLLLFILLLVIKLAYLFTPSRASPPRAAASARGRYVSWDPEWPCAAALLHHYHLGMHLIFLRPGPLTLRLDPPRFVLGSYLLLLRPAPFSVVLLLRIDGPSD